ncbi:MAG: MerR family transcriptional regulator [Duodenibacillus sp.]|nr:MerR family transcriptional regulator [Duodenibacillus sp.]
MTSPDRTYTRKEVCSQCGLEDFILRYWEMKFPGLRPPAGAKNRVYTADDVALIWRIKKMLHVDRLTIPEAIRQLSQAPAEPRTQPPAPAPGPAPVAAPAPEPGPAEAARAEVPAIEAPRPAEAVPPAPAEMPQPVSVKAVAAAARALPVIEPPQAAGDAPEAPAAGPGPAFAGIVPEPADDEPSQEVLGLRAQLAARRATILKAVDALRGLRASLA